MRYAIGIRAILLVFALSTPALAEDLNRLNGVWQGTWSFNQNTGSLVFTLNGEPAKRTLAASNVPGFGSAPVPLQVLGFKKNTLEIRATGADMTVVEAALKVNGDATKMSGWATHMGQSVWFDLRKTGEQ